MAKDKPASDTPETVVPTTHVRVAVLNIIAELAASGIAKERTNQQQGFKFRGIDDVLNALASLYVKNRIVVLPSYNNRSKTEHPSKSGGTLFNVTLEATYRIVSLVDGSELISGPFFGEGMDSGDKATNKAMSIAYKYFALQTYAIPLVGSDDPDFETHEVKGGAKPAVAAKQQPVASAPQSAAPAAGKPAADETVEQAINRLGKNKVQRKQLETLLTKAYDVVLVEQIPADKRAEAIARIETYVTKATTKTAA